MMTLEFQDMSAAVRFMGQWIVDIADLNGRTVRVYGLCHGGRWERLREIAEAHGATVLGPTPVAGGIA